MILTDSGKIYCFGGGSRKLQELDLGAADAVTDNDGSPQSIAFAGVKEIAVAVKPTDLPLSNFKSVEKLFLKKLCAIFYQVRAICESVQFLKGLIYDSSWFLTYLELYANFQ